MPALGDKLRAERERKKLSLDHVSAETRIHARYLGFLEDGAYEELPGGAFTRAFIREYGRSLGLDPAELLADFERESSPAEPEETESDTDVFAETMRDALGVSPRRSFGLGRWGRSILAIAVPVVAIGLAAYFFWPRSAPPDSDSAPPPREEALAAPNAPVASDTETVSEPAEPAPTPSNATTRPAPAVPEPAPALHDTTDPAEGPSPAVAAPILGTTAAEDEAGTEAPGEGMAFELSVPNHGVGTAVVERNLVGRADRFPEGSDVVFWTRVLGGGEGATIVHVWSHESGWTRRAILPVRAAHWRTFSRRTLEPGLLGQWSVEAQDPEGRVLARLEFTAVPGASTNIAQ